MSNLGRKLTLVLTITDPEKATWLWEAHKTTQGVHGVKVQVIAEHDQVTVPGEITEGLAALDPDFPNKKELRALIEKADSHI